MAPPPPKNDRMPPCFWPGRPVAGRIDPVSLLIFARMLHGAELILGIAGLDQETASFHRDDLDLIERIIDTELVRENTLRAAVLVAVFTTFVNPDEERRHGVALSGVLLARM